MVERCIECGNNCMFCEVKKDVEDAPKNAIKLVELCTNFSTSNVSELKLIGKLLKEAGIFKE